MDQMSDYDIQPNSSAELWRSPNFGPSLVWRREDCEMMGVLVGGVYMRDCVHVVFGLS